MGTIEYDPSYVDCSNCFLGGTEGESARLAHGTTWSRPPNCGAPSAHAHFDSSLNKLNISYETKLKEYKELYNNYHKNISDTTDITVEKKNVLLQKAKFHNQSLLKMEKMIEYLVIVYWILFLLFIGKNVYFKKMNNQKIKYSTLLVISPFLLSYTTFFIGLISDFYEKHVKTLFANMFLPMGEFIVNIISAITGLFSSIIGWIYDLIAKILNIFPFLFESFKKLFFNITPDMCKHMPLQTVLKTSTETSGLSDPTASVAVGNDCYGNLLLAPGSAKDKWDINGQFKVQYADISGCSKNSKKSGSSAATNITDCSSGDLLVMNCPGVNWALVDNNHDKKTPKCTNGDWDNNVISSWPVCVTKTVAAGTDLPTATDLAGIKHLI